MDLCKNKDQGVQRDRGFTNEYYGNKLYNMYIVYIYIYSPIISSIVNVGTVVKFNHFSTKY